MTQRILPGKLGGLGLFRHLDGRPDTGVGQTRKGIVGTFRPRGAQIILKTQKETKGMRCVSIGMLNQLVQINLQFVATLQGEFCRLLRRGFFQGPCRVLVGSGCQDGSGTFFSQSFFQGHNVSKSTSDQPYTATRRRRTVIILWLQRRGNLVRPMGSIAKQGLTWNQQGFGYAHRGIKGGYRSGLLEPGCHGRTSQGNLLCTIVHTGQYRGCLCGLIIPIILINIGILSSHHVVTVVVGWLWTIRGRWLLLLWSSVIPIKPCGCHHGMCHHGLLVLLLLSIRGHATIGYMTNVVSIAIRWHGLCHHTTVRRLLLLLWRCHGISQIHTLHLIRQLMLLFLLLQVLLSLQLFLLFLTCSFRGLLLAQSFRGLLFFLFFLLLLIHLVKQSTTTRGSPSRSIVVVDMVSRSSTRQ
mmetsp:Transcript_13629/g.26045  ORF Transcript_13629/g.26045 Transcript_13629/m.26045 type:complete len:411 (-) Transcript_13629:641-1873(-)